MNTEAQKGKTILDTHFSYVGKQFYKFVSSGRDMHTERRIFDALFFDGGVSNSTTILADFTKLDKAIVPTPKFKIKSSVSRIHDIIWKINQEIVELRLFSGYNDIEILRTGRRNSSLIVTVSRKYADRNYDDHPKHQEIRNALQAAAIFPSQNKQYNTRTP